MPNNYVLLDRIELNNTAASVTFDNIPQSGYTDLKIVISARDTSTSDAKGSYYTIAFNGGSSYAGRYLQGNGTSVGSGVLGQLVGIADTSAGTANTFSNDEIYIPNYKSTSAKSYSVDSVTEQNATGAYATLVAGSWSGGAVTTITFTPSVGSFVAGSTFSLYGIAAVGTTPAIAPKADGGNVIGTDGTYWYHAFLSNGTFTPQVGLVCDYMVVAGGGGGGGYYVGGGGGAGGFRLLTSQTFANTSYAVTIGAGGTGGPGNGVLGTNGTNSSLIGGSISISATGGGRGDTSLGTSVPQGAGNGGSGGGATYLNPALAGTGNAGGYSPVEGYAGGTGFNGGGYGNGAGGGAGGIGGNGTVSVGGAGGVGAGGTSYTNYTIINAMGAATSTGQLVSGNYYYAGGGGGSAYGSGGGTGGPGGNGGGGAGSTGPGTSGTTNTGGGGGGGERNSSGAGGNGGSGIIIIRYPVAS